jgi:ABC-type nitrate/sulfonate/bicarbonate transport system ATPase subunit
LNKIELDNISKVFKQNNGGLSVLENITFGVKEGDFVCIVGESGCGKTTLFRLISGLEQPTSGSISIDGKNVIEPSSEIGLVFQNPRLLPWLSVEKNIEFGFRIRKKLIPDNIIEQTINLVGIKGFEKTKPKNLSGGMAQRAAIARAIVTDPSVLLMDEPFGAIDALTRTRLQKELTKIWLTKKMTIVFITHDIEEAISLATKIIVLTPRPGKIRRIFQISIGYPRNPLTNDFFRLKGTILDELTMY